MNGRLLRSTSYIENQICSIYGLTLDEIAEIAKAKEEGRLEILPKERVGKPQGRKTIREKLSRLYYLNREIEQETKRLKEFESQKISGLPHEKQADSKTKEQIEDCKIIIDAKRKAAVIEYKRLIEYIEKIDDSLMRQIISLRYVNGYSWTQVAMHIGGGNTAESVKKACYRYIKKSCPECPDKLW